MSARNGDRWPDDGAFLPAQRALKVNHPLLLLPDRHADGFGFRKVTCQNIAGLFFSVMVVETFREKNRRR